MNAKEALDAARGRTVIVGEHHWNKDSRMKICLLMRAAHDAGYRKLGLEIANESCAEAFPDLGLIDALAHVRNLEGKTIPELQSDSLYWRVQSLLDRVRLYMGRKTSGAERMNVYWYIQTALDLKWDVVAIDEFFWDWVDNNYFERRDPAMAKAIAENGRMIVQVGNAHLMGLQARLGETVQYVNTFEIPKKEREVYALEWGRERTDFLESVPFLTA